MDQEPSEIAWRERLLKRSFAVVLPLSLLAMLVAIGFSSWPAGKVFLAVVGPLWLVGLIAALRSRGSYRVRACLLLALLLGSACTGYALVGLLGGPALVAAAAVVMGGLLLGTPGAIWAFAVALLGAAAAGAAIVTGVLPVPGSDVDLSSPTVWFRTLAVAATVWAILGAAVGMVLRDLTLALGTTRAALEDLRVEQGRREYAEEERYQADRERIVAEQMAIQSQRQETVGQLAAGIAHDFNNALTVIQCWTVLALEDDPAAAQAIQQTLRQAATLSRQLLALGRHEARTPSLVALAPVVDSCLHALRGALPADIEVAIEHGGAPHVVADEVQIHQVIFNLAINARDAMPDGGRLVVRTSVETVVTPRTLVTGVAEPGAYAVLAIEDTGAGMPEAVQEHAFKPFFTTKESGRGTGLGLATVYRIVTQHGGHLALRSAPGEGSCFSIYLPLAGAEAQAPDALHGDDTRSLAGAEVLIVEDNDAVRNVMSRVLTAAGCRVIATSDVARGVDVVRSSTRRIQLVCTDVVMPGLPVRELFDEVERHRPDTPILVCSGYLAEELASRGIDGDRFRVLAKPFAPAQLERIAAELIAAHRAS